METAQIEELRRLADEALMLRRLATAVARETERGALFELVARETAQALGIEGASILRFEGDDAVVEGTWAPATTPYPVGFRHTLGGEPVSPLTIARYEARPAWVGDYAALPPHIAAPVQAQGQVGGAAAPIMVEGRVWGAIVATSSQRGAVGAHTSELLGDVAELLGLGVARSDARQELAEQTAEDTALRRVATAVGFRANPEELFAMIGEELCGLLGAEVGGVARFAGHEAVIVGSHSAHGSVPLPPGQRLRILPASALESLIRGGPPQQSVRDRDPALPYRARVAAPIYVASRVWGAVLAATNDAEAFRPRSEARVQRFAELASMAIVNADATRALAEEVRRRSELADVQAALHRVARTLAMEPDLLSVAHHVAEEAGRLFGADVAGVHRYLPDGSAELLAVWPSDYPPEVQPGLVIPYSDVTAIGAVWSTRRPATVLGYPRRPPEVIARCGVNAAAAAPVVTAEGLWGVVALASRKPDLPGDLAERLGEFAELVTVAILAAEARALPAESAPPDPSLS